MNRSFLLVLAALGYSAALAQHTLPTVNVTDTQLVPLPQQRLITPPSTSATLADLSDCLVDLPGVSLRRQGGHAAEPVIRGLAWERVTTQFNGLPLHGACPSRMDPPLSLFRAGTLTSAEVDPGPSSVIHGPPGLGGGIRLDSAPAWNPEAPQPPRLAVDTRFASQGNQRAVGAFTGVESSVSAASAQAAVSRQSDYEGGNGVRVPARQQKYELGADAVGMLSKDLWLAADLRWIDETDTDYPALPMDTRSSETLLFTPALRWTPAAAERLREIEFRLGLSRVDHLMDNRDKPNRALMRASTPSTADTTHGRLLGVWDLEGLALRGGMDATRLEREATRTRIMNASGMRFTDPIWPDLVQDRVGGFLELEKPVSTSMRARAGLRVDRYQSEAGKAGARIVPGPAIGPITVRQAWRDFGGAPNAEDEREDTLVSGNVLLNTALNEKWTLGVGLSRVESMPNLTQLYRAFSPEPGGYGVGNPDLEPETKHQVDLRLEGPALGIALFAARIDDFALPAITARTDIDGDGVADRVRGTRNVDAALCGAELQSRPQLAEGWFLPLSAAWVRGWQIETDDALPEIPPVEASIALRWEGAGEKQPWAQIGVRQALRQDRVDRNFGEDPTPSFAVVHLRTGISPRPGMRLEAGIENLLDRAYHEHLTREAVFAGGDLRPGDEIPAPGRSFTLALRMEW